MIILLMVLDYCLLSFLFPLALYLVQLRGLFIFEINPGCFSLEIRSLNKPNHSL